MQNLNFLVCNFYFIGTSFNCAYTNANHNHGQNIVEKFTLLSKIDVFLE